jgi:uncharacterized membrane protein
MYVRSGTIPAPRGYNCATPNENDPKQILKVRLAKGEITKEAFLDLQKLISDQGVLMRIN